MQIVYVLIVARSTFQSHCRALAMCRDIFSFLIYIFHNHWADAAYTLWIEYYKLAGSTLTGGRAQLHCDLTQSYILYSLCIHCIINCSFSMHLHLFQQNNIYIYIYIYISGRPLSALTCCVNVRLLSAIIYSQSWVGSWVYTTQAMMTFTLIF